MWVLSPPQEPSFAEQAVPALLGITGGLLPACCGLAVLGGGRSATAGGAEAEREGDSHARATGRGQSRVAVVPLAPVAGLASSAGVWQRLVMLAAGPKGSASTSPGFAGCAGAVRGKGSPLGVEECRCAHLS